MTRDSPNAPPSALGRLLGAALVGLFVLPLLALVVSASPGEIATGLADPRFGPALWLSLRTTVTSLAIIVVAGTPLSWWMATSPSRMSRGLGVVLDLPVVIPPAVVGVGLLQAFGRQGLLGPTLEAAGIRVPFTQSAVVLAQVVVAGPFFVQAATTAFRKVEPEAIAVARTLGATPRQAFVRIAIPIAGPGLLAGASLAWARALGEFGATLLFAGNLSGRTQTMPLAIFSALESDLRLAVVFSLFLVGLGAILLLALRLVPRIRRGRVRLPVEAS